MFAKDLTQHKYYESMFTSLFLHSLKKTIGKCYKYYKGLQGVTKNYKVQSEPLDDQQISDGTNVAYEQY